MAPQRAVLVLGGRALLLQVVERGDGLGTVELQVTVLDLPDIRNVHVVPLPPDSVPMVVLNAHGEQGPAL